VSKHSQSRGRSRGGLALAQLAPMVLGAILTGVAWAYLVGAAIDFGVVAVGGEPRAWLFTVGASIGAVVCLVLMLALVGRGLRVLGFFSEYQPRRAAARRRRR
jgi:hypothetical protein